MIRIIFDTVVIYLEDLGSLIGTSYEGANIIIYSLLFPIIWTIMIGVIYRVKVIIINTILMMIGFIIVIIPIQAQFDAGVRVVEWLDIIGWDYYEASVYACVIFPLATTLFLIILLINRFKK